MVKVLYNDQYIELKDDLEEGFEELDLISDSDVDFESNSSNTDEIDNIEDSDE